MLTFGILLVALISYLKK
ncbi:hypothetical protein NE556_05385 [[Clostridium] symbiosum]|uniref:Uncharacterized protein n=1 Tax=Clostridium symbiosum TaxID=1512 RepID=A0AAW6ASG6_CLOSY|nr:hypothetical protein [[Clostridium] symbiosum]MCQ4834639.1 hypothetical protein [[Clostridium] symbiosum]MDB1973570.1 hypothetical protein [[Clostridium] symbiosum]MDB1978009.1 hypothetical protein [[Clostridium] symbiosum]MDB1981785.1 hypothetical protein [[Clostridium] symbiosum]MDB1986932.1 hypothetical protein [[Clostridium] symbiosum]